MPNHNDKPQTTAELKYNAGDNIRINHYSDALAPIVSYNQIKGHYAKVIKIWYDDYDGRYLYFLSFQATPRPIQATLNEQQIAQISVQPETHPKTNIFR